MKASRILKLLSLHGSVRCHFSQYGEDVILHKLFGSKFSDGFYIDVGAHHPFRQSNTAYLWLMGWRGVNVDASKKAIDTFNKVRKNDVNIWSAVVDDETASTHKEITLYSNQELDLGATCNSELAKNRETTRMETVPCTSLTTIINQYTPKGRKIDFLNIDIEGFDQTAIAGIDKWVSLPRIICVEIFGENLRHVLDSPACHLLEKKGYELIERVGCSALFQLK